MMRIASPPDHAFSQSLRNLSRRAVLFSPALLISPAHAEAAIPPGVPSGRRLAFDVLRNGDSIGKHELTFATDGDTLTVTINIKIAAGLGPIKLFRYDMDGNEVWRGGRFVGLTTTSNDDGAHHSTTIQRTGDGLHVQSAGLPDYVAPANAAPLTHWSVAALSGPLLSPQDGQIMKASIVPAGRLTVPVVGRSVVATGYNINTHTPVQDWYDADQVWVSTHANVSGGSNVEYRRIA